MQALSRDSIGRLWLLGNQRRAAGRQGVRVSGADETRRGLGLAHLSEVATIADEGHGIALRPVQHRHTAHGARRRRKVSKLGACQHGKFTERDGAEILEEARIGHCRLRGSAGHAYFLLAAGGVVVIGGADEPGRLT